MENNKPIWDILNFIEESTKKDDLQNIEHADLESILVRVHDKLVALLYWN